MHIKSPKTTVEKNQQSLFEFLTQVENYEKLMPESLEKFVVIDKESFLFQLKGMPEIALQLNEKTPYNTIIFGSKSDKVPFSLQANITEVSDSQSEVELVFDGKFNSMMAMMVKSPLKKFINTLSENMGKL